MWAKVKRRVERESVSRQGTGNPLVRKLALSDCRMSLHGKFPMESLKTAIDLNVFTAFLVLW